MDRHPFRAVGVRTCLPGHRCLLRLQIAQQPVGGEPGDEAVSVAGQLGSGIITEDNLRIGHEQHQQHRRVPSERQPRAHSRAE